MNRETNTNLPLGGTAKVNKDFQWTDDESELLLNSTYEYKVEKAAISIDWESVKSKYDDILERFRACLPERRSLLS